MLFGQDKTKPPVSGAEMMLRSFGMGEIIDMAKAMASNGTFEKILSFTEQAERIEQQLKRVEDKLDALIQSKAGETIDPAGTDGLRWPPTQSGAGSANGGLDASANGHVPELPGSNGHS